jgi:hypothetical protein
MMNQNHDQKHPERDSKKDEGILDRLAKKIDPPGQEVDDQDILDPGRMTPGAPPVDNRT